MTVRTRWHVLGALLALCVVVGAIGAFASQGNEEKGAPKEKNTSPAQKGEAKTTTKTLAELSEGLPSDISFDRFVSEDEISQAVLLQDPALLADVAFQLLEGERVLFRQRQGLSSEVMLDFALRAASDHQDKVTLDRLSRAAKAHGKQNLAQATAAAMKLASSSREAGSTLSINPDDITPEDYTTIRAIIQACREGKLAGDVKALEILEKGLPSVSCLTDPQRKKLAQVIGECKKEAAGVPDSIRKLSSESRGSTPLLGVKAYYNGTGMQVIQVLPNTHAAREGMLVGDVIYKINGQPMTDEYVFTSTIASSGGNMLVEYKHVDGHFYNMTVGHGWSAPIYNPPGGGAVIAGVSNKHSGGGAVIAGGSHKHWHTNSTVKIYKRLPGARNWQRHGGDYTQHSARSVESRLKAQGYQVKLVP